MWWNSFKKEDMKMKMENKLDRKYGTIHFDPVNGKKFFSSGFSDGIHPCNCNQYYQFCYYQFYY